MKDFVNNIKFAWTFARENKIKIYLYILCNILQVIISVIVPIISASIIVKLTNNELMQVVYMALVLFIIENVRNLLFFLSRYFAQVTYRETFTKIQLTLGKSILKLKNSVVDDNSSGVFIQRLTNDTSKMADIFNVLSGYLRDIVTNIGIFGAVFIIDYRVGFFMLISVLILGIIEMKRVNLLNEKDKVFRKYNENASGFIGELVRGVRDIKMLSAEKSFLSELENRLILLNSKRYEMGKVKRDYSLLTGFIRDLSDGKTKKMVYNYWKQENEYDSEKTFG